MQIKSSYLIEEFKKPFVVAYLVPNLDNPAVREEAVKSMFGAANDLYGSRPKTSHTVYLDDDGDSEFCADCGKQVGLDVAEYSRKHFGGVAYCRDCQRNHTWRK